jgi:hypothetical protein
MIEIKLDIKLGINDIESVTVLTDHLSVDEGKYLRRNKETIFNYLREGLEHVRSKYLFELSIPKVKNLITEELEEYVNQKIKTC